MTGLVAGTGADLMHKELSAETQKDRIVDLFGQVGTGMILDSSDDQPLMRTDSLLPKGPMPHHAGAEARRDRGPGPQTADEGQGDDGARHGAALPIP
jgi:hypothetical protein